MDYASLGSNVAGVLIGAGIAYGVLREQVVALKERLIAVERVNTEQDEKIFGLRDRGQRLVFRDDCRISRDECRHHICVEFDEVKKEIRENRDVAAIGSQEVKEFMGYVKGVLEELKARRG